jgi:nitronate monooxygenase
VHPNLKQALIRHNETDTRLIMRSLRNTERVLHNRAADKVLEIEGRGNTQIQDLIPYVSGLVGKEMMEDGDMEKGTMAAGQCIGLIRDIPTCRELLDRIMAEAEEIIKTRFGRMLTNE